MFPSLLDPSVYRGYGGRTNGDVTWLGGPSSYRADPDPMTAFQRVNEILTGFLIRLTPPANLDQGIKLFPVVNVSRYLIQYGKTSGEETVLRDTERAAKAEISVSDSTVSEIIKKLRRFTHGWIWDQDTIDNAADPYDLAAMGSAMARQVVLLWLDKLKADKVSNVTPDVTYGAIQAGGSWSGAGTMLGEVNAAAETISTHTGVYKDQFTLFLFNNIRFLAERDPLFLEYRSRTQGASSPSLADMAAYLGIKEVQHITSVAKTSIEAAPSFLFPDFAVLAYLGTNTAELLGGMRWGATFRWGQGAALQPWYENRRTSWVYPFQMREISEIIDPDCAVAITNPS